MSTTTAGGMTVSSSGGITLDSNDVDNTKGVSGLASVSLLLTDLHSQLVMLI